LTVKAVPVAEIRSVQTAENIKSKKKKRIIGMNELEQKELLEKTRLVIDLQQEKKQYNSEINNQIKEAQTRIKKLAKEGK